MIKDDNINGNNDDENDEDNENNEDNDTNKDNDKNIDSNNNNSDDIGDINVSADLIHWNKCWLPKFPR